jgi:hypothetical protein
LTITIYLTVQKNIYHLVGLLERKKMIRSNRGEFLKGNDRLYQLELLLLSMATGGGGSGGGGGGALLTRESDRFFPHPRLK